MGSWRAVIERSVAEMALQPLTSQLAELIEACGRQQAHIQADHRALQRVWQLHQPVGPRNRCQACSLKHPCPTYLVIIDAGSDEADTG